MSTTDEENILEKLIEAFVSEALRGFNIEQFKMLDDSDSMIQYAQKFLPEMGQGSSRKTFALSSSKVLKISLNPAGRAQNKVEVDVFTDPQTKPVVTRIFDADLDLYRWVIAEIVQPLTLNSEEMFKSAIGIDFVDFTGLIDDWYYKNESEPGEFIKSQIKNLKNALEVSKRQLSPDDWRIVETQRALDVYQKAASIPLIFGVISLIERGLLKGDLSRIDHYGKTIDGRVVILDYGFSKSVQRAHY